MIKIELIKISKDISEVIADLKTSLKQEMEKDLRRQLIISEYLDDTEKNTKALTLCRYKAEGCKRIELDFPDTLIAANQKLILKFEAIRMELAKRYAITLGTLHNNKNEEGNILLYTSIKLFLDGVFKQFDVDNIVVEKILDFLVLCLKRQENSIDIYKSNEGLQDFFDFISFLSEKKFIEISIYIEKLDTLENKEFFLHSNEIQKSFYGLVHEINGLIIYKILLAKLSLLFQSVFSEDLFLKEFIKSFINEFTSRFGIKKADFESIYILIYLTLETKARTPASETRNAWINSLGSMVKKLAESEISPRLNRFKNEYEQKIDGKFKPILEQFKRIDPKKESMIFRSEQINPKIIRWVCLENINRSSFDVKCAFLTALNKTAYLASKLYEKDRTAKNNLNPSPETLTGIFKKLVVESKSRLSTVFQEYKKHNMHTQVNTSPQASLRKVETDEELILALVVLHEKLKKIESNLREFNKNIKNFVGAEIINFFYSSVKGDSLKNSLDDVFSTRLDEESYSRLKIEIEILEKITNDFFRKNNHGLFFKKLREKIRHINDENSWFENKFFKKKQVSILERVFKRGYFLETQVQLTELKARLGRQISFELEKDFFLEKSFFTLLRYGIIRWFWLDKETFARNWAEQVVFLKIIAEINEYEEIECCILDEDFNSTAKRFQKLAKLALKMEKKYFKEGFFSNLEKDIKSFEAKIENLFMELKNCSLFIQEESNLPVNSKATLNFFDNQQEVDSREINDLHPLRPK